MRVLIVQYAGDYREAVQRFAIGEGETYYAQQYSVDTVAALSQQVEEIAVLCCLTAVAYDEPLPNGVRAMGAGFQGNVDFQKVTGLIKAYAPTHLIVNMPVQEILDWAIKQKIPTLTPLADSFAPKGLKEKFRSVLLAKALNHPQIEWVANHGVTAAESLRSIGVKADKIIPWDWPHIVTPDAFPAKTLLSKQPDQQPDQQPERTLVFVGSVVEAKGVGDVLAAVSILRSKNIPVSLKLAGKGELESFQQQATALGIAEAVDFLGLVENKKIIDLMRSADLVLVPSRHEYPEGFPMTIYEALCSRTPIVASDHPMFVQQLQHRSNAMIFPAGNSAALANEIEAVLSDTVLYHAISEATAPTWQRLQIPVKMGDLLKRWVAQTPEDRDWLYQHRLGSGLYSQPSA